MILAGTDISNIECEWYQNDTCTGRCLLCCNNKDYKNKNIKNEADFSGLCIGNCAKGVK